ncbi:benzoate-CoA ligase family protein [Oceanibacterium hippocampi]|uniref:Benzoate--CoA ligase n=1 Tax=Oceanibacterium hippocampi TaxID=745714 RepID=A0A1Y5SHT2_9PROT|nr:benzoate-CoA ligase family protein [Oceanibacterium hippocampi]SLN37949.1 Benzoate--CoA ligase [Oceanibacterium hippocampi]
MPSPSSVEPGASPPRPVLPRDYNAASDFIDRHLAEGRGDKLAVIDDHGRYSYADIAERVNRAGNAFLALGILPEQRIALALLDTVDFYAAFWGALKIGAVPVPLNTLLTAEDYAYMLRDSRAVALLVSDALSPTLAKAAGDLPRLSHVIASGDGPSAFADAPRFAELCAAAGADLAAAETTPDDIAFWLYSSGSTGKPKGVVHLHGHLVQTAVLYGGGVLEAGPDDVFFSAAKLFFAYGLGNAMTFPLHVGGTAVLMAERPTPAAVMKRLKDFRPTIFFGVPTLYAAILGDRTIDRGASSDALRLCVSAGEALPEDVARRWTDRFGVPILDGIGSTEMLHIFLSNRVDATKLGSTGKAVPGYELKVVGDDGAELPPGELGELMVRGPSTAAFYWNNRAKTVATFQGDWCRTGDKYIADEAGFHTYAGRADDMLKVSGIWVSPFEVESALVGHDDVLEAAVVGHMDADELVKPKAYVVLRDGLAGDAAKTRELQDFVKSRLAPYKYPRWIEFRDELPKTATGKIQRFKLRG